MLATKKNTIKRCVHNITINKLCVLCEFMFKGAVIFSFRWQTEDLGLRSGSRSVCSPGVHRLHDILSMVRSPPTSPCIAAPQLAHHSSFSFIHPFVHPFILFYFISFDVNSFYADLLDFFIQLLFFASLRKRSAAKQKNKKF